MMGGAGRACVLIPTYNERGCIDAAMDKVFDALPDAAIIVIDDGSPDGTAARVMERSQVDPRIRLLSRPGKLGLGTAYVAGMTLALQQEACARVVTMDADLSHPADRLSDMLAKASECDLVIGSRYVPGGATRGWDWRREVLSRTANVLARCALGTDVRDVTAGFRCYRADALRDVPFAEVTSNGYAFQVEMTHLLLQAGKTVSELPITFTERANGRSKMSGRIVLEAVGLLARVACQRMASALGCR